MSINIGAGLPVPEDGKSWRGYKPYFEEIEKFHFRNSDESTIPIAAEPGRALVGASEALLIPINVVDQDNGRLILSQSLAGGLHHSAKLPDVNFPLVALAGDGRELDGQQEWGLAGGSPAGFEGSYPRKITLPWPC